MNDKRILQLTETYGTPLYVFDVNRLRNRIEYLRNHLPKQVKLCYAAKANTFLIQAIEPYIDLFEICSPGEFQICDELHIPRNKIVMSGVVKRKKDIQSLFSSSKELPEMTIESLSQLEQIHQASVQNNRVVKVLLRMTSGNQFGLDRDVLMDIIQNRHQYQNLIIDGIQFFSGTQKHSSRRVEKEIKLLAEVFQEMEEAGYRPMTVEYGPGFPVDYFSSMRYDEKEHLAFVSSQLKRFHPSIEIVLELGRSLAAECGFYMTSVVDTKTNQNQNYALVDGGIHQLTYYGQGMAMKLPPFRFLSYRQNQEESEPWNVCGSLCTVNDILMKQAPITRPQAGDVFVFERAGAYCVSEGMALFLTRDLPAIVLLDANQETLVRNHIQTVDLNSPKKEEM